MRHSQKFLLIILDWFFLVTNDILLANSSEPQQKVKEARKFTKNLPREAPVARFPVQVPSFLNPVCK